MPLNRWVKSRAYCVGYQACPLHATSEAGASNLDHCVCKTGYSKANLTAKCAICPAGKYWNKNDFDEVSCVLCPENSYGVQEGATSPSQCETCPLNTQAPAGSDALSDCLCMPGAKSYKTQENIFLLLANASLRYPEARRCFVGELK
jgi:hypothetical protein